MKLYTKLIVEATNCTPDEAVPIEQCMRDANGGTLDHLDRRSFIIAARRAQRQLKDL